MRGSRDNGHSPCSPEIRTMSDAWSAAGTAALTTCSSCSSNGTSAYSKSAASSAATATTEPSNASTTAVANTTLCSSATFSVSSAVNAAEPITDVSDPQLGKSKVVSNVSATSTNELPHDSSNSSSIHTTKAELTIEGYSIFRADRKGRKHIRGRYSGGAAIYLRSDIAATTEKTGFLKWGC